MKITGYRTLSWSFHRGHLSGDANSVAPDDVSWANYLFLETDAGVTGIAPASSPDVEKLFPVIEGKGPRGVIGLRVQQPFGVGPIEDAQRKRPACATEMRVRRVQAIQYTKEQALGVAKRVRIVGGQKAAHGCHMSQRWRASR